MVVYMVNTRRKMADETYRLVVKAVRYKWKKPDSEPPHISEETKQNIKNDRVYGRHLNVICQWYVLSIYYVKKVLREA